MKIPKWIHGVEIPPERSAEIDSGMGNWVKFAPLLKSLTEDECKYVIRSELEQSIALGKMPRPDFIYRPLNKILRKYKSERIREIRAAING